jgi:hypothetical protein
MCMQDGDRGDYSESNYDSFAGYGEKLFSAGNCHQWPFSSVSARLLLTLCLWQALRMRRTIEKQI